MRRRSGPSERGCGSARNCIDPRGCGLDQRLVAGKLMADKKKAVIAGKAQADDAGGNAAAGDDTPATLRGGRLLDVGTIEPHQIRHYLRKNCLLAFTARSRICPRGVAERISQLST